jgi:hypothetical protein
MDLLAENILKEKVESSSFAWTENQRDAVISAMSDYHNKKRVATEVILNGDIVKLKNFVAKHKPHPHHAKTIEAQRQYERDLKEWDELMRL